MYLFVIAALAFIKSANKATYYYNYLFIIFKYNQKYMKNTINIK